MIISKVVYNNTGNSVANHSVLNVRCDECRGAGKMYLNMKDFKSFLEENFYMEGFCSLAKRYRAWKKEHTVDCQACEGRGRWEEIL